MGLKHRFVHRLMSRRKQFFLIHTWHWWSKHNICICIQGQSCCKFWFKSSLPSRYQPIQKVHLRNKSILKRVNFWLYMLKLEKLKYILLCKKRPNLGVLDTSGQMPKQQHMFPKKNLFSISLYYKLPKSLQEKMRSFSVPLKPLWMGRIW